MTTRTFTKQNTFRATLTTNEDGTATLVNSFRAVGTKDKWEDQTRTYTYTVFDGPPASSGSCAWPSHEDIEIEADSPIAALDEIESAIIRQARKCGEYSAEDHLWITVWDGPAIVGERTLTVGE